MNIVEVRDEQFLIRVGDDIISKPNSPYYTCKLAANNDRIEYRFNDQMRVQETFDDRIFNAFCGNCEIQFRQDLSDPLSKTIIQHQKTGNVAAFQELFTKAREETPRYDILEYYLSNLTGVKRKEDGYIIDGIFKVDYKGNARFKQTDDLWHYLCIVTQGNLKNKTLLNSYGRLTEINALTMTIISKIMFLMSPNMKDNIFVQQLPKSIRVILEAGGDSDYE